MNYEAHRADDVNIMIFFADNISETMLTRFIDACTRMPRCVCVELLPWLYPAKAAWDFLITRLCVATISLLQNPSFSFACCQ